MKTLLMGLLLLLAHSSVSAQAAPQLRAFWVDGYNAGFKTPQQCRLLLERTRAAHMNCIIVEMRKQGDAYYTSHYEPWATDDPQGFDALSYLCRLAHQPGLPYVQVYAWVNICAVGGSPNPQSVVHLYPDWLSLSDTGSSFDGESTKIDLGDPAAAEWTVRVCLDLVRHYPIDGLQMDSIRYGGIGPALGHWGYNPVSVARYDARYHATGSPAWNDPRWMQWRRDQVTDFVRRVSVSVHALKPNVVVSADTICWGKSPKSLADYYASSVAYRDVFADWVGWLREGLLDLNCPMTYINETHHPRNWQNWSEFIKNHQYQRLSTLGIGEYLQPLSDSFTQIASASQATSRGQAAAGVTLFSYATTNTLGAQMQQYNSLFYTGLGLLFAADTRPPSMPWLTYPTRGVILGRALEGPLLTPLDGAAVLARGAGHSRTTLCDGNGFFAFLHSKPGAYHLRFLSVSGQRSTQLAQRNPAIIVRPGCAHAPLSCIFGTGDYHRSRVQGIGRWRDGTRVLLPEVVVSSGSDHLHDHFFVVDHIGSRWAVRVSASHLLMPTVKGDIVAVTGTVHHTRSGIAIDALAVRTLGAVLIQPPPEN